MDTAQWPQDIVVKPIDEIVTNTCIKPPPPVAGAGGQVVDRKAVRPHKDQALNCPRCNSMNTKFCYYNNYSLTQPRYFCKTCRRYWTEGGSLRNIPVGGGSRKNKRSSPSASSAASKKPLLVGTPPQLQPQPQPAITGLGGHQNPKSTNSHEGQDLNLAFSQGFRNSQNSISEYLQVPIIKNPLISSNCPSSSSSALEIQTGISSSSCSTTFMPLPSTVQDPSVYTAGSGFGLNYSMQEFMRPSLSFSLDGGGGSGGGYGGDPHDPLNNQEEGPSATATAGGRLLFPFESLKLPVSSSSTNSGGGGGGDGDSGMDHHPHHHHHDGSDDHDDEKEQGDQSSAGFWSGMLGGGGLGGGSSWQL